jgi:probable LLM family oxidoreductase
MGDHFEIGLYTFAELSPDPLTGNLISPAERLHQFIERVELAEKVGLDVVGLGEHHRPDFVSSAPEVILAAAAARTRSIRLSSAVTVLSSDDPVRVFQRFATLDLISNGRAEIMAGRGSFTESFPLFGYDLNDYSELFVEKLNLLLKIRAGERVTWSGQHRSPLDDQGVYPRPVQEEIPIWIAVGGTPQSVVRAGILGLNLALAIIGGYPEQFAPLVQLYRQAAEQAGHDPDKLAFSINSHGFIADDRQQALDESFPYFQQTMNRIGRERGFPPMTRESFNAGATLRGANFIGTSDDVIEKILFQHELFGHQRFLLMPGLGTMPHEKIMHTIELLGTKVAPIVRKEIARRTK